LTKHRSRQQISEVDPDDILAHTSLSILYQKKEWFRAEAEGNKARSRVETAVEKAVVEQPVLAIGRLFRRLRFVVVPGVQSIVTKSLSALTGVMFGAERF